MNGGIGVSPTRVPDAMRPQTGYGHETDLSRLLRLGDVPDPNTGGKAALVLQDVGRRTPEIGLFILEFLHGPYARRIHGQEQILVRLQVEGARARGTRDEIDELGVCGIAHVKDADAVAEAMADVGKAAMHHDLDAIATAAHVGMADELDIARGDRLHG